MANTVAQHSVATFTSPVNGTTPIDANTVRGNDNTTRTAYNDHDADPGIHVQSSTLASRPVAGTAGRKWITNDSDIYTLWFDDGTNWHPVSSENVALTVYATTALSKGDVVKVTGWNNGQDLAEVAKVSSASDVAFAIMSADVTINTMGYATNTGLLIDVNTNAFTAGDILYPNTSGGLTATKPTSGIYQPAAYVLRKNTNNGVLYVEFSAPRIVEASANTASTVVLRDASGDFSAGTITATAVNTTTIDLTNLEVTNIKAKDGTASMTLADSTGVVTVSAAPVLSALTASQAVFTNSSKALVSNAITGTGNVVMSASPTLTGTIGAANLTLSGTLGVTSTATFTTPLADSNLATISTAGKVSNSATTATSANTASAIVARDSSGNFSAGTITANLTGNISGTAPAGTLTGTTLASNVVTSSLTTVGTIGTGVWQGTAIANSYIATGLDVTKLTTGTTLPSNVVSSSLTSVGTLSSLAVTGATTLRLDGSGSTTPLILRNNNPASTQLVKIGFDSSGAIKSSIAAAVYGDDYMTFNVGSDTERMRLTSTGLGIGTSSPATKVHAYDATSATIRATSGVNANLDLTANATDVRIGSPNGVPLLFRTSNATQATLDASGNLGIGVTPSAWASSAAGYSVLQVRNAAFYGISTNIARMSANAFVDGSGVNTYISNGYATRHDQQDGEFKWLTAPSGTAGNAISFTQAMTLGANGNLLLGGTNDYARLTVSAADAARIALVAGATRAVRIGADSTAAYVEGVDQTGVASYQPLFVGGSTVNLYVNGSEKLRVDATTTAGQTALLLWDVDNGTLERVTVGAADSGGVGYKVLRIPN